MLQEMINSTDCFRWDFATSVEEVMTHLHAYVMAKQVLYIGVSDTPAWVVVKANACTFDPDDALVSMPAPR